MSHVVFIRAANVGGHQVFQPSAVARNLSALDPVNIGAAGTFVIRKKISESAIRAAFRKQLSFDTDLNIVSGDDLLAFMRKKPFDDAPAGKDYVPCVGVLAGSPLRAPHLPIIEKPGDDWQVRVAVVTGRFAVILRRRTGRSVLDPSAVIEKHFGVRATIRNWTTMQKIHAVITGDAKA